MIRLFSLILCFQISYSYAAEPSSKNPENYYFDPTLVVCLDLDQKANSIEEVDILIHVAYRQSLEGLDATMAKENFSYNTRLKRIDQLTKNLVQDLKDSRNRWLDEMEMKRNEEKSDRESERINNEIE